MYGVKEGLLSHIVTRQDDKVSLRVEDRNCEHSAELLHEVEPPDLIRLDDYLSLRVDLSMLAAVNEP